jgi:hypothetical protein
MGVLSRCAFLLCHTYEASSHFVDEFKEPAKVLCHAGFARLTDQEMAGLAESWQRKREKFDPELNED